VAASLSFTHSLRAIKNALTQKKRDARAGPAAIKTTLEPVFYLSKIQQERGVWNNQPEINSRE
jgi:hypothetical protein